MFKINVVGGIIRGLKLESDKSENLRPTKDRIKESLFDILNFDIKNKIFLDLFGGTGQIGIEAFSRGAKEVHIVEHDRNHFNLIKKNVLKIKTPHNIKISKANAVEFLEDNKHYFDIIFIDPPYKDVELMETALSKSTQAVNGNGIIVLETSSQTVQNEVNNFSLQKKYRYGSTYLYLYKSKDAFCV